jgi:hypothetical protein
LIHILNFNDYDFDVSENKFLLPIDKKKIILFDENMKIEKNNFRIKN